MDRFGSAFRPALFIFDFDGVIADSEVIALEELAGEMTARGAAVTVAEARSRFLGVSTAAHMAYITEASGQPGGEDFADVWHARLYRRYRQELTIVPGIGETLDLLDACGIAFCIASGGSVERIAFALDCLGLAHRFEGRAFSADMVERGKPAPDLFLHAARAMGVEPGLCVVVEDAPSGMRAARAAGMPAIGFLGGSHVAADRDSHAAVLLKEFPMAMAASHEELMHLIRRMAETSQPA